MDIKNSVDQIDKTSNPIQRIIVAIVAPIVIVLLGYGLMNILDNNGPLRRHVSPDELDESWWLWLIIITCVGIFEYTWFRNRDK